MSTVSWFDRTFYPAHGGNWDATAFREVPRQHRHGGERDVLDPGAGAGIVPQMNFRGLARQVCGIDPDPRVTTNPYLDEAVEGIGESIPYPDASFDVVFADDVLEHLERAERVFEEVKRGLRDGGVFLATTLNRVHSVPLIAAVTPHVFHEWVNALRGRDRSDTFPTHYRAHSAGAVRRLAAGVGFAEARVRRVEGRLDYLRMSALTYPLGLAYERLVNGIPVLEPFRLVLIAEIFA